MTNRERAEKDFSKPYMLKMAEIQAEESFNARKEAEDRARSLENGTKAASDLRLEVRRMLALFGCVLALSLGGVWLLVHKIGPWLCDTFPRLCQMVKP